MSRENTNDSELLGRLPRHRARGRSPHRDGQPDFRASGDHARSDATSGQGPLDSGTAATAQEAVRMAAEVADIALTAAALLMRELLVRLEENDSPPSPQSDSPR